MKRKLASLTKYPVKRRRFAGESLQTNIGQPPTLFGDSITINQMPDDILIKIFQYLHPHQRVRIERVSKNWNRLSLYSWTKFHVFNRIHVPPKRELEFLKPIAGLKSILSRCGLYLKHVDFGSNCNLGYLNCDILSFVNQYCPNVENIKIHDKLVTNFSLGNLAQNCLNLRTFTFETLFCCQDGLISLLSCSRQLISLDLIPADSYIPTNCLQNLPHRLKHLNLFDCYLVDNGLKVVADRCPNLETLKLDRCRYLTNDGFDYAFRKLSLKVFSYRDILFSFGEKLFFSYFPLNELRELYLDYNMKISKQFFATLSANCENLEKLHLKGCARADSDQALFHLCLLKNLTDLNLDWLNNFTDVGLSCLAKEGRLNVLSLENCHQITGKSVEDFGKFCPHLIQLNLKYCRKIRNRSLFSFATHADARSINLTLFLYGTKVSKPSVLERRNKITSIPKVALNFDT